MCELLAGICFVVAGICGVVMTVVAVKDMRDERRLRSKHRRAREIEAERRAIEGWEALYEIEADRCAKLEAENQELQKQIALFRKVLDKIKVRDL